MEQKTYRIDPKSAVGEIIDGEAVIINLQTGSYFSADGVGAAIWGCIEKKSTYETIVREVGSTFDGSPSDHEVEIASFLQQLLHNDLIIEEVGIGSEIDSSVEVNSEVSVLPLKPFVSPTLNTYSDMQDLLLLDPIHDVSDSEGWPVKKSD